jgi:hypothetical protein
VWTSILKLKDKLANVNVCVRIRHANTSVFRGFLHILLNNKKPAKPYDLQVYGLL